MKKQLRSALCWLMVLTLSLPMLLTGCGAPKYMVQVVDELGNPYTSGVVVKFFKDGQSVGMQAVNDQGIAEKELEKGEYTVDLLFTAEEEYRYDVKDLVLSVSDRIYTVKVSKTVKGEATTLSVGDADHTAYSLDIGCTYVTLKKNERNYFLFTPTVAGTYEFSVNQAEGAAIGYYGAPHYVQETNMGKMENGKFTVSIKASMIGTNGTGTTTLVLGVDAADNEAAIVAIQRIGEPEHTIEDEPWIIYQKTVELKEYTLPAGAKLAEFDLKAPTYKLVLNEQDGFYHLNTADGPLVLMRLGEKSAYLDSFKTILDRSGVVKYFYDDEENFVKKESYSECLLEYIEYIDEANGVYPLTEDLKYIVQQRGDHSDWFDSDSSSYLFKDAAGENLVGLNKENLWLFMCCYINP